MSLSIYGTVDGYVRAILSREVRLTLAAGALTAPGAPATLTCVKDERRFASERDRLLAEPSFGSLRGLASLAATIGMMPGANHAVNAGAFQVASVLDLRPEHRLIEVGCGAGVLLRSLAGQVEFEQRPTGFDISRRAVTYARRLTPDHEAEFIEAPATKLPIPEHSIDVALCGHVTRFLADGPMYAFLLEMMRVLKPGGRLLIWDYAPSTGAAGRANEWLLTRGGAPCHLRSYGDFALLASQCRFGWIELLDLRPFFLPPIPRVTVLLTRGPLAGKEVASGATPAATREGAAAGAP
jgi:SAM-dependent methyltransferase